MEDSAYKMTAHRGSSRRMVAPRPDRMKLEELLLRHGAIDAEQLRRAQEEQKALGGDMGRVLVALGYINDGLLCRAQSHRLGIPVSSPEKQSIAPDLLQLIPVHVCERLGIIAVGRDPGGLLQVATNDPANAEHLRAVAAAVGERFEPVVATSESIERAIRRHYYGEPLGQKKKAAAEKLFDGAPDQSASNPQLAALLARVERLEQQSAQREEQILQALRTIGDILVETGLVSREEYLRRARGK